MWHHSCWEQLEWCDCLQSLLFDDTIVVWTINLCIFERVGNFERPADPHVWTEPKWKHCMVDLDPNPLHIHSHSLTWKRKPFRFFSKGHAIRFHFSKPEHTVFLLGPWRSCRPFRPTAAQQPFHDRWLGQRDGIYIEGTAPKLAVIIPRIPRTWATHCV